MLFLFPLILGIAACGDDDMEGMNQECDTKFFVPEEDWAWLPYNTDEGSNSSYQYFLSETDTQFLVKQDLSFYSEAGDTQVWRLIYVEDEFWPTSGEDCPKYQRIEYTLYNNDLSVHIPLGLINKVAEPNPSGNEFITEFKSGACNTTGETGEGILLGTCYTTSFDLDDPDTNTRSTYFPTFETAFHSYENVYEIKIDHSPQAHLYYTFYISKEQGLVAYEVLDVLWAIN